MRARQPLWRRLLSRGHVARYVGGDISRSSTLAQTRTYGGGATAPSFSDNVSLSGNLYDGAARVDWSSGVDAYGAVYAGDFNASSAVRIHYDRQVTLQGQACPSATPDGGATSCGSCKDCNNQACINGTCGACGSSADCRAPLVCTKGSCVLPIQ